MPFKSKTYQVVIDKLIHGGQGLGTLDDGKKALVWNVLPGERVSFDSHRSKSSYVEGVASKIIERSAERETPKDEMYLSTSPWQMMTYEAENRYKKEILAETLQRAGVDFAVELDFFAPRNQWHYRNKMEYSFYGDDEGLHLALFNRGTHRKQIVSSSSIARPEIDEAAGKISRVLSEKKVRAGDLKSLIIRCNRAGECVAALFTRNEDFPKMNELDGICKGIVIYFSNPKSPASVATRKLSEAGDLTLTDMVLNKPIKYDVLSFFQVNLEPYEAVLQVMHDHVKNYRVTDMYAGVGSIGLSVSDGSLRLIEIDRHSAEMARQNTEDKDVEVIEAASEAALEYIPSGDGEALILDPPRAGLHAKVSSAVLENLPEKVIYLSCNPSTLARDLEILQQKYRIEYVGGYNFFPRTPHIEALAVLALDQAK